MDGRRGDGWSGGGGCGEEGCSGGGVAEPSWDVQRSLQCLHEEMNLELNVKRRNTWTVAAIL